MVKFKEKNIVIVFSNKYPDRSQLSKDRWRIFEISKDLKDLVEKYKKCDKQEEMPEDSKKRKKCDKQEEMSENSMSEDDYSE